MIVNYLFKEDNILKKRCKITPFVGRRQEPEAFAFLNLSLAFPNKSFRTKHPCLFYENLVPLQVQSPIK